jgi:predicted Zn-ribbon and HTH transcriptional regulator
MRYAIVVHDLTKTHARTHAPNRQVGDIHAEMDDTCPDGLPNCRHCGDPAHADSCRAAGHCPHCGTRHGIAPESVLTANGYRLEPH